MPSLKTLTRAAGAALVAFLLAPPGAAAQNLLPDGSFDHGVDSSWLLVPPVHGHPGPVGSVGWSPVDVGGSPSSGSLLLANDWVDAISFVYVRFCLPAVEGEDYRFGVTSLVPSGQAPSGDVLASLRFYSNASCDGISNVIASEEGPRVRDVGTWVATEIGPVTAPPGTRGISVRLGLRKTEGIPGPVLAHFDDAYVEGAGGGGDPEPPAAGWFADPAFPGFRFNVLITAGGSSRLGTPEPTCLPETVCVSGALPGRVEVFLRIVGPRPNGHLWPTLFKASTSRFDVWIEQLSTGVVKHYVLEGAAPGSSELPGLFDREGFLP